MQYCKNSLGILVALHLLFEFYFSFLWVMVVSGMMWPCKCIIPGTFPLTHTDTLKKERNGCRLVDLISPLQRASLRVCSLLWKHEREKDLCIIYHLPQYHHTVCRQRDLLQENGVFLPRSLDKKCSEKKSTTTKNYMQCKKMRKIIQMQNK